MSTTMVLDRPTPGWLRSQSFDLGFIGLPTVLAVVSGAIVIAEPRNFGWVLALDLWLLGFHHVISTYTRLCFDKESFRQHRFLVLYLPFIVFGITLALAAGIGIWAITTIYLYWQWFHYTRQSWGISQVYRRKSGDLVKEGDHITKLAFYLLPLWGILHRSWQAPERFLGVEVWVVPVPLVLVNIVAAAAIASLIVWGVLRVRAFLQGRGPVAHTLYMASHFAIFTIGYLAITDVTYGWLVINIWHNAQYVMFVWLYNANRFKNGRDSRAPFLSTICQPNMWWAYLAVCLSITCIVYLGIMGAQGALYAIGLTSLVIVFQTINFHHYIVDGLIWKTRKPTMQKTLGLSSS